jgi:hypothetical protein
MQGQIYQERLQLKGSATKGDTRRKGEIHPVACPPNMRNVQNGPGVVVVYPCNPSTWEDRELGQPGLHSETLPNRKKKKRYSEWDTKERTAEKVAKRGDRVVTEEYGLHSEDPRPSEDPGRLHQSLGWLKVSPPPQAFNRHQLVLREVQGQGEDYLEFGRQLIHFHWPMSDLLESRPLLRIRLQRLQSSALHSLPGGSTCPVTSTRGQP